MDKVYLVNLDYAYQGGDVVLSIHKSKVGAYESANKFIEENHPNEKTRLHEADLEWPQIGNALMSIKEYDLNP